MTHEGLPVTFGQLEMSTRGISDGKATLPWDDFGQITLDGGEEDSLPENIPPPNLQTLLERLSWWQNDVASSDTLLILRNDKHDIFWSQVVSEVPNAFLLMELANSVCPQ